MNNFQNSTSDENEEGNPFISKSICLLLLITLGFLPKLSFGIQDLNYAEIHEDEDPEEYAHLDDSVKRVYQSLDMISEMVSLHANEISPIFDPLKYPPITIEGKLQRIQKEIPLPYNSHIQLFIEKYSHDRYKTYLSNMLSLGTYYFTIYDKIFDEMGVPNQLKYLSIVESALNPHAVSRAGATGPWQFMFATAKMMGLVIDRHEDQRKDPIAATYAAGKYLSEMYDMFGDWHLALAAYNCGPGNVKRAIERSGLENPNFWELINFLPKETRNYVPAFIALTYVLEYKEDFGIEVKGTHLFPEYEVVNIKQSVSFKELAASLNVEVDVLKDMNPQYKRAIINASLDKPKRIILPPVDPIYYDQVYAVLYDKPIQAVNTLVAENVEEFDEEELVYSVKRGDNLGSIARRYKTTVQNLKAWNNLKSNNLSIGQKLIIENYSGDVSAIASSKSQVAQYTVKKGDTLSGIAKKYSGVTVNSIKDANGLKNNNLKPGMKLKIM